MNLDVKLKMSVIDNQQKTIYEFQKGEYLSNKEIKNLILDEMKDFTLEFFDGDFYLTIIDDKGRLYQCILYKWLYAQYLFDETPKKQAFGSFIDFFILYGYWICNHKAPKKQFTELADQIQKIKEKTEEKQYISFDKKEYNKDTILNGKKLSEWEEKQKEYDRQRLELINKGF
jgi:hypothetical protein